MTNYTKSTNFTAKDSLPSGDSQKIIRGSEFDTEFNAIETAVNSKADKSGSVLNLTASSLLIGTTTDFTSASSTGPAAFGGIGIYPFITSFDAVSLNTTTNSIVHIENQSVFSNNNGASYQVLAGISSAPKVSNTGANGTQQLNAWGGYFSPVIVSTGSNALVRGYGVWSQSYRGATNDLSSNTLNVLTGGRFAAGHTDTLPVTARTETITGVTSVVDFYSGVNAESTAYRTSIFVGGLTPTTTTGNVSGFRVHAFEIGGASGGAATVTNGYGVYLRGPKVSATGTMTNYYAFYADTPTITGTLTNRWGLYVADTANNYLNGNLLLGTTTVATNPSAGVAITGTSSNWNIGVNHPTAAVSGDPYATFVYNTTQIGSITQNGTTGVLYNTTSDLRLKENIAPSNDAGSLVDSIQIVQHDWKVGGHVRYGVIAQDLHAIAPEAVKQGDNNQEIENPWGVDYSKLVPMLIKEIQSLRTRVATLENN